jgi:hypothetical protein
MTSAYAPTCPACRSNHPSEFHRSCDGCRARQIRIAAEQRAAALSEQQFEAMDSTMTPLPSEATK